MKAIQLKDIFIGNIDAKNELLSESPDEIEQFKSGFIVPPNIILDNYINKNKYFITGLKGTGKTALLRYLAILSEDKFDSKTFFILFKSNIDEDDRKKLSHAARSEINENNSQEFSGQDFELVWRWFLHKKIIYLVENKGVELFQKNGDYSRYKACVTSVEGSSKNGLLDALIPRIKKGNITISKTPKLSIDLVWNSQNKAQIKFVELAKNVDSLFLKLLPGNDSLNIYIDELELNLTSKKQYDRDSRLIRDLIVTIEKLNNISKRNGYDLCIFAGIRSEVVSAITSTGKEINKPLSDFGSQITWHKKGIDETQQPLLDIIIKRLKYAEVKNGITTENGKMWDKYFPLKIQGVESRKYILHNSWYRPRDFVRLLSIARDQFPYEAIFSHKVFDDTRKQYSTECWTEITEELIANYSKEDLAGIKRIFYGFQSYFEFADVTRRCLGIKELYPEVRKLLSKHEVNTILTHMYKIGILGNLGKQRRSGRETIRFSFRGDDDILLENKLFIHHALRPFFSI